ASSPAPPASAPSCPTSTSIARSTTSTASPPSAARCPPATVPHRARAPAPPGDGSRARAWTSGSRRPAARHSLSERRLGLVRHDQGDRPEVAGAELRRAACRHELPRSVRGVPLLEERQGKPGLEAAGLELDLALTRCAQRHGLPAEVIHRLIDELVVQVD